MPTFLVATEKGNALCCQIQVQNTNFKIAVEVWLILDWFLHQFESQNLAFQFQKGVYRSLRLKLFDSRVWTPCILEQMERMLHSSDVWHILQIHDTPKFFGGIKDVIWCLSLKMATNLAEKWIPSIFLEKKKFDFILLLLLLVSV